MRSNCDNLELFYSPLVWQSSQIRFLLEANNVQFKSQIWPVGKSIRGSVYGDLPVLLCGMKIIEDSRLILRFLHDHLHDHLAGGGILGNSFEEVCSNLAMYEEFDRIYLAPIMQPLIADPIFCKKVYRATITDLWSRIRQTRSLIKLRKSIEDDPIELGFKKAVDDLELRIQAGIPPIISTLLAGPLLTLRSESSWWQYLTSHRSILALLTSAEKNPPISTKKYAAHSN